MLSLTDISATGQNAIGLNVVGYLRDTEKLDFKYVGYMGMAVSTQRWRGHGAAVLGLEGKEVDEQAMIELAAGYSPDGKKTSLCQNAGAKPTKQIKTDRHGNPRLGKDGETQFVWKGGHQVGYDCVFSAPKPVSLLMAIATPEERGAILAAHRDSVDKALEFLEGKVETRRGKAGKDIISVDGMVITSCDHLANRKLEPHLHTHNLIYGVAYADGKWGGWESSELYRHQKAADVVYMTNLAENLRKLGYGIEQQAILTEADGEDTGFREWKVAGIDQATIDAFSTRKSEILDAMEEGVSHHQAWAQTRAHKDEPSPEELFATWEKAIPAVGQDMDIAKLKELPDVLAPQRSDEDVLQAFHASSAIVNEAEMMWTLYRSRAGLGPDQLAEDLARLKSQMVEIAPERQHAMDQGLNVSRRYSETRYSDRKIVDWEQEVLQRAATRKDDASVRVPAQTMDEVVQRFQHEKGFTLSDEQRQALEHLCVRSGGHAVMAGVAGAGKTTVAELYKQAFEANGQHLIGACVSRKAAGKLAEESGMEAMSITKILGRLDKGSPLTKDVPRLTEKSVVVLDEAGMVDTEAVRRLMRHVDAAGAKLILQGDSKQLQPIGAGAGMSLVSQKLGQAELTEIRRQKNEVDRDIAITFYDRDEQGRIVLDNRGPKARSDVAQKGAALWKKLEARGAIDAYNTREEAADACVQEWLDCSHTIDNRLLLVHDHADAMLLTDKIREGLRERGVLSGQDHTFRGRRDQRMYDMEVAVGDQVRITKNDNKLGVENGDMAVVEEITRTPAGSLALNLRVEGQHGKPSFSLAVDTNEFNHLQAGYCRTVHDAQGQGRAAVFHFANAKMMDNQSGLVAFTRLTSDRYRMYGAEVELEQVKNRLGADRLKQNATQEGLLRDRVQKQAPTLEQEFDEVLRQRRQNPGLQR
ncbi:MobF family relaxase [Luteimonas sp. SDU101]|uniref:MobF family relaxase n=1 Tax=Luteimonas sp. SDU101 TaxID=3422593 RepID=UPI003EB925ED